MKNRFFLHWVLPLLIAAIAISLAIWFITKAPKAKPKPTRNPQYTIVEATKPELGEFKVEIESVGEVIPFNSLNLTSKVSGEVIELSPNLEPGGTVKKGELLATIDDRDYQLIKKQRDAAVQKAKSDLDLEYGRQVVAENDLKLLKRSKKLTKKQRELALRKPQLLQYQAGLMQAQAALDETKLAIERTKIYAPWNAIVLERNISVGTNLSPQQPIATLVASNKLRIKTSIPASKLKFIKTGEARSTVQITSNASNDIIIGEIFSVLPSLSTNSRMAQLLIDIESDENTPSQLKINDFVQVKIIGKQLENVYRIPRAFIRDGNSIWLMHNRALSIIYPTFVHEDKKYVYFDSKIETGDMLITSNLSVPVEGMELATRKKVGQNKPMPSPKVKPQPNPRTN
ncbi:MAG: efflux RND transporter periplasmic adaptor subunit [Gammaproteobacteria bacterium]|nr:MAG: efflux RND transporter periplasmic adaptor subunit [Gammaproteobacteria bacterium]